MKTLYMKNLLADLKKHWLAAGAFLVFCLAVSLAAGQAAVQNATVEEAQENTEYEAAIEEYDSAYTQAEEALGLARTQAAELGEYIDNSIYMKLPAQDICVESVQYAVTDAANTGNVLNAFVYFINDGELKDSLTEAYPELEPKYWREVLTPAVAGNTISITLYHYDEDMAAEIMSLVCGKVEAYAPKLFAANGEFGLQKTGESSYKKGDAGVTNTQNGNRNNLKGYETNIADLETKLAGISTSKANYIEKNEPKSRAVYENPAKTRVKYLLLGLICGILLPVAFLVFCFLLGNRLQNERDIEAAGLCFLGNLKEDASMDALAVLSGRLGADRVAVDILSTSQKAEALRRRLAADDRFCLLPPAGEEGYMEALCACSHAVFAAEPGMTTWDAISGRQKLCGQLHVCLLGAYLVK